MYFSGTLFTKSIMKYTGVTFLRRSIFQVNKKSSM